MPPDLGIGTASPCTTDSHALKRSLSQSPQALLDPKNLTNNRGSGLAGLAPSSMVPLIHCRLVEWSPSAVVAIAASTDGSAIAAARESGDIEIWSVARGSVGWNCELRIPGKDQTTITSLFWTPGSGDCTRGRLFSGDLEGHITEWNLHDLVPKAVVDSYGGPVWSMAAKPRPDIVAEPAAHPNGDVDSSDIDSSDSESDSDSDDDVEGDEHGQMVAVGCDDGCVRLFSVTDDEAGLQYHKSLPRVQGRVLSTAWSVTQPDILFAGGSDGCIRCWNVTLGRELYVITVAVGGRQTDDLCVWALLALRDGTIVSGDGSGSTQFWESKHGTLLQVHRRHSSDVLALATTPSQQSVFAAGVDGQIILYQKTADSSKTGQGARGGGQNDSARSAAQWICVGGRRAHTHDIRALVVATLPWEGEEAAKQQEKRKKRKRQIGRVLNPSKWALPGAAMLISGGNDARLVTYPANAFMTYYPHLISNAPHPPHIHLANGLLPSGGALMLTQHKSWMDIWHVKPSVTQASAAGNGPSSVMITDVDSPDKGRSSNAVGTSGRSPTLLQVNGTKLPKQQHKGAKGEGEAVPKGRKGKGAKTGPVVGNGVTKGGKASSREHESNGAPELKAVKWDPPGLVARIKIKGKKEHIACSAISPNGQYVACSDWSRSRLFEVTVPERTDCSMQEPDGGFWQVRRRKLPEDTPSAHCMAFSADSSRLLLASRGGGILVVDVEEGAVIHEFPGFCPRALEGDAADSAHPATTHLCTSSDGQWMAAADSCGHISVFHLESMRHYWEVPKLDESKPTVMMFHPGNMALIIATASNRLHVLDVEARDVSKWSHVNATRLPARFLELAGGITGLSIPPSPSSTSVVAYNASSMCHIDLSKPIREENGQPDVAKRLRLESGKSRNQGPKEENATAETTKESDSNFKVVEFQHPCLFLGYPDKRSLLLVEKPWKDVLQKFPASFARHKYGT